MLLRGGRAARPAGRAPGRPLRPAGRCPATWCARGRLPSTPPPAPRSRRWSGVGGFDSSAEELYFQLGVPGAERGWNVFVFDGPGQLGLHAHRPDDDLPAGLRGAARRGARHRRGLARGRRRRAWRCAGQSFGSYFAARVAAADLRVRRPGGQPAGRRHGPLHGGVGRDRRLPDEPRHPARGRGRRARGPHAPADAVGDRGHLHPVRRAVVPRLARRHGGVPSRGDLVGRHLPGAGPGRRTRGCRAPGPVRRPRAVARPAR